MQRRLKDVTLDEIVQELRLREGTREMLIESGETHLLRAWGSEGKKDRRITGSGPAVILEIKR